MAKINFVNKTQIAVYDAAKWNAQDANEVKTSVNDLYDDGLGQSVTSTFRIVTNNGIGGDQPPSIEEVGTNLIGVFTGQKLPGFTTGLSRLVLDKLLDDQKVTFFTHNYWSRFSEVKVILATLDGVTILDIYHYKNGILSDDVVIFWLKIELFN